MAVTENTWNPLTDSVIEETDGAGNVLVEYTNEPAPYGPLISERRGSESRQYHFDALGSTRALTDDSQTVTDTFVYDASGQEIARSGANHTPYLWLGSWGYRHSVSSSDSYDIRHRLYRASQQRWMSVDPLGTEAALNGYLYSRNSAIFRLDPSGLCDCCCCPKSIEPSKITVIDLPDDDQGIGPGVRLGLAFRVTATLEITMTTRSASPACSIEWFECSDQGGDLGQKPGVWFKVPNAADGSPPPGAVTNWLDPPSKCPETIQRYWGDSPSILNANGNSVRINFVVRVKPGLSCNCGDVILKLSLKATVKDANLLFPAKTVFDPNPPVITLGLKPACPGVRFWVGAVKNSKSFGIVWGFMGVNDP